MKTKRSIAFPILFLAAGLASAMAQSGDDPLIVTNGDFSDLTGLQEMSDGWYSGVPAGWSAAPSDGGSTNYAIRKQAGNFVANVSALSRTQPSFQAFTQEVGILPAPAEVTLTFAVVDSWHGENFYMGAAIYDARAVAYPLAAGDFTNAGTHTLVASNVPAGTQVKLGFWTVTGFPSLDNVAITVRPNE